MNFIAHLFWNHLPYVEQEKRMINGKEEVCLIIPTKTNQMKKGKWGNWLSSFTLREIPPNEEMMTHRIVLDYLNNEEVEKAKRMGYYKKSDRIGRMRELDCTPSKKINRDNSNAIEINVDGFICLDNIPQELMIINPQSKRFYAKCTFKRKSPNGTAIFATGAICIDDIPPECIITNPRTGKRNVRCRFKRSDYMDTYFNTHELVCITNEGSEIEIGRFREWTQATKTQQRVSQIQNASNIQQASQPTVAETPTYQKNEGTVIDGLNL